MKEMILAVRQGRTTAMSARRVSDLDSKDSRRVAACLRACAGIPTESLEDDSIMRLVAACVHVEDAQVRAALEALIPLDNEAAARAAKRAKILNPEASATS